MAEKTPTATQPDRTGRIRTQRELTAMVALDTIDLIAMRVENLLKAGRRMTLVRRFTYVDRPPEVTAGLRLEGKPRLWKSDDGAGFGVRLQPGLLTGFGFSCYGHDGNTTEAETWKRYRAGESMSSDWFKRRRDMTEVEIVGGLPGDGPARDDKLVIRPWNGDGVCEEVVVGFDYGPDREEIRGRLARHLWATDGNDPQEWDRRSELLTWGRENTPTLTAFRETVYERNLARADEILAVIAGVKE